MALSPLVIGTISTIAGNRKVQETAARLASDVYGRVMRRSKAAPNLGEPSELVEERVALKQVQEKLEQLPSREELAVSFGLLQAELDRRLQLQNRLIILFGGISVALLSALLLMAIA